MVENIYVAGFCFLVSVAGAAVVLVLAKRAHKDAVANIAALSARIEAAHQESAVMTQSIQAARAGLEKKITRNAMQSITKQAKDLTSAVIGGA